MAAQVTATSQHDSVLAEVAARQDRFLALLQAQQRPLAKICWVYCRSVPDRDDLYQEILSRLWVAFPQYDPKRPFLTWMYRIALNVAIDVCRRQRRWQRRPTVGRSVETTHAEEELRDQLQDLRGLLEQLSDPDRALLLLHLEGHAHRAIGDILGISESNVGTRLSRLKAFLRKTLQSEKPF